MFTTSEKKSNGPVNDPATDRIKTTRAEIKNLKAQLETSKKKLEELELEHKSSENQQTGTPHALFSSRTSSAITADITLNQGIQARLTKELTDKEMTLSRVISDDYIIDMNADIKAYPPQFPLEKSRPGTYLPVGDLHGNALKLIYILVRHQFIKMSKNEYDEIVSIYNTPIPKETNDKGEMNPDFERDKDNYKIKIRRFREIIAACFEKADPNLVGKLILMGDLIGDRGKNDLFTILLMPHLIKRKGDQGFGIVEKFIASNHDDVALVKLFKGIDIFTDTQTSFKQSLVNLEACIDMDLVDKQEILGILEEYYIPNLKALDYAEYEEDGERHIDVYCHAPCHVFKIVDDAARTYYITDDEYDLDNTIETFFEVVDKLNKKFTDNGGIMRWEYHPLFDLITYRGLSGDDNERITSDAHLPPKYANHIMHYFHGHDKKITLFPKGKTQFTKEEVYKIMTESALPQMRGFDNTFGLPTSADVWLGTAYVAGFLRGRQFKHDYVQKPKPSSSLKL